MTRKRYKKLFRAFITDLIIYNKTVDKPVSTKRMYRNLETIHPAEGDSYAEAWAKIQPAADNVHELVKNIKDV